jgi:hypothetical protein
MTRRYCAVYRQSDTGRVRLLIAHALNRFTASRKLPRNIVEQGMKFRRQGGIKLYPTGESDHENT